jgi:hypothetical protein
MSEDSMYEAEAYRRLTVAGTAGHPTTNDQGPSKRRRKTDETDTTKSAKGGSTEESKLKETLITIWKNVDSGGDIETAIAYTKDMVQQHVQSIVRLGLDAFHNAESLASKLSIMSEELKQKDIEIHRLRSSEEKNGSSMAVSWRSDEPEHLSRSTRRPHNHFTISNSLSPKNLARALEHSRSQTQDAARSILVEARLRAEVSTMMSQRDEAIGQAEEYKHKASLVQEQFHNQQTKLSRVTQEKIKLERDCMASQRATKTLVQSMETNSTSTDNEFYNRKISELNGRIQSQGAVIAEKNRQIDDMRRQLERNVSQSRWTNMGSSTSAPGKRT